MEARKFESLKINIYIYICIQYIHTHIYLIYIYKGLQIVCILLHVFLVNLLANFNSIETVYFNLVMWLLAYVAWSLQPIQHDPTSLSLRLVFLCLLYSELLFIPPEMVNVKYQLDCHKIVGQILFWVLL